MKHVIASVLMLVWLLSGCAIHHGARTGGIDAKSVHITPDEVANRLNNRYTSIRNDCREFGSNQPRGAYYCSGVIIRGTDDGPFPPWEYSPAARRKGSVSFSWIRRDLPLPVHVERHRNKGFVLWSPVDEIELGRPPFDQGFICIYPFNAFTLTNMKHKGCGYHAESDGGTVLYPQPPLLNRNSHYAWGQCEGMGITSVAQWMALWEQSSEFPALREQCSWNVESQAAWGNLVTIIKTLSGPDVYEWNEMLLDTMDDDGTILMPHIAAVFWSAHDQGGDNSPLDSARIFQAKLEARGTYVPILRLDRLTTPDRPFSYHIEDQGSVPR